MRKRLRNDGMDSFINMILISFYYKFMSFKIYNLICFMVEGRRFESFNVNGRLFFELLIIIYHKYLT